MKKIPTLPINNYLVLASILICFVFGYRSLASYGAAHWHGTSSAKLLSSSAETLAKTEEIRLLINQSESLEVFFNLVQDKGASISAVYEKEMKISGIIYSLCALLCIVLSVLSLFSKPRWVAILAVPLGLLGANSLMVVM